MDWNSNATKVIELEKSIMFPKFIFLLTLTLALTGCSTNESTEPPKPDHSVVEVESTSSGENEFETPTPTSTNTNEIEWDQYPGLRTKLDYFIQEKNCDGILQIQKEFGEVSVELGNYLELVLKNASCL